jgi:prepilin peptidase CpaA
MIIDIVLLLFVALSIYSDIKYRKVFNFSVLAVIILGLGLNFAVSGLIGIKESLIGFVVGFLVLFLVYLLGGMGAGDVKFLAGVGALKGANFVLYGTMYGAVIAGLITIIVLLLKKRLIHTVKGVCHGVFCLLAFKTKESIQFDKAESIVLPYAALLAVGMLVRWFEPLIRKVF